jgi:PP-loop superfamily ATP-utilizing enzyme
MRELAALETVLRGLKGGAIAVSGGVDSMTLAIVAGRLPEGAFEMFHALSPAVPADATARVRHHAAREGWTLREITAGEFDDPAYRANPVDRCFHCKTNLYGAVCARTEKTVLSGTNRDDLGDYRPPCATPMSKRVSARIRCAPSRAISGSAISPICRRRPASPAGSKPASGSRAISSPSSTRWKNMSPAA